MALSNPRISKSHFLDALICRTRSWYSRRQPIALSAGTQLRMREGQEIGRLAHQLFPDGVFAGDVANTVKLFPTSRVLFEASFEVDGYIARADILEKRNGSVVLVEVKSSLYENGQVKPEYIDDMAYTAMVLKRAGIVIDKVELLSLSREWRLSMPIADLFCRTDHTVGAIARAKEFDALWTQMRNTICDTDRPTPELVMACRDCSYFESHCLGKDLTNPVFHIPRLSKTSFDQLKAFGIHTIDAIPHNFVLSENQLRVCRCVKSKAPEIDEAKLKRTLSNVIWPAGYLDFETFKTAVPMWPQIAPHETIVTQYSLHICDGPGKIIDYRSYLAEPTADHRRDLADQLLAETAELKSIIVYSNYEQTILHSLGRLYPGLQRQIQDLIDRLFDLEKVFKEAYCHPGFRGRTSIKCTLPALVPEMTYGDLSIKDGDAAIAAFVKLARGQFESTEEAEAIKQDLRDYCERDTLGMVRLHEVLMNRLE